jgi:transcriptional regulator with XRE-family HTH domain
LDSIRKVFAFRLREFRGNRTQDAFAEQLDLSKRTYQELESGNVPQKKTLLKLVKKLGLASETPLFLDPDLGAAQSASVGGPHQDLGELIELVMKIPGNERQMAIKFLKAQFRLAVAGDQAKKRTNS